MADRDTSPTSSSSVLSHDTVATAEEPASRSSSTASPPMSTPPTSLGDEASILSEVTKMESIVETQEEAFARLAATAAQATPQSDPGAPNSESRRPARSSRKSVTTYNVQILAGTAIHTPTKYLEKHHGNVLHGKLEDVIPTNPTPSPKKRASRPKLYPADLDDPAEQQLATEAAQAAQRRTSSRVGDLRRDVFRNLAGAGEAVAHTISAGKQYAQNALRRSASDSRLRSSTQTGLLGSPGKRPRTARGVETPDEEAEEDDEKEYTKPKTKKWESQGLYVGQHRDFDARLSETQNRARRKSRQTKESQVLPLPMFSGERMLDGDPRVRYRPFKLPYDTYSPLPRKIKVDGWVKLHKNRFIGDASALWKRDKQDASQCYCDPEDGCGEACHNRIMAYECDSTNCPLTPEQCGNRPFAQLKKRAKGNGYDYGVEVMETDGKGYGVRAMRTFEPHQIIVEYAGEIITQTECERRMKQVYKKDKCYYLMSFDNKMIIDATRGTIARFVNHSCEPNCEMIKWTVSGEPRMALFAGSRGIVTGEELTYDYNFDPFSSKNIQECRCGTKACRGVLGPKPKKPAADEKFLGSTILAGTKRKLQELYNGSSKASESDPSSPRKRAMHNSTVSKERNRLAEEALAKKKAEEEAAAQEAQRASREDRALKRGGPMTLSRRSALLRKTTHATASKFKSTRTTTFSFQRKAPKPGALKPVKHVNIAEFRRNQALKGKQALRATKTPKTPERSSTPESSSEDDSPNITPASLRSANKKPKQLTQTKLNFASWSAAASSSREPDDMDVPDTEDEGYGRSYTSSKFKGKKRGSGPAPRGMRKTGAGVKKTQVKGPGRGRYVRRAK